MNKQDLFCKNTEEIRRHIGDNSTVFLLLCIVETMACIEQTLKNMGIPVFAKFDHGKNAQDVMATEYGLDKEPVIGKMQKLLEKIVIQSASVY